MGNIAKAREGYKPPTGTVQVVIDAEVARERKTLLDQIDAAQDEAKGRVVTPKLKKLRDELDALTEREREHVHKLRMVKLPGVEWNDLADKYPPRLDVQFDLDLGYNHHAVALAAARMSTVELVEKDGAVEEVPLDDEDWDTILEVGSGWDIGNIVNLQINLNVLQASNRLGRLKKD
jgi:hypothetical protein